MQAIARLRQALTIERRQAKFNRNAPGWTLVVLDSLAALNSTFFFLTALKSGAIGWLMMNTCAPSIALFVTGSLPACLALASTGARR